jgi:Trk K+ transport system NAD-binding subunit
MIIVIAGGGSVGRFIAEQLVGRGHRSPSSTSEPRVVSQYEGTIEGASWCAATAATSAR